MRTLVAAAFVLAATLTLAFAGCGLPTTAIPADGDAGVLCSNVVQCDDGNPCTTDACSETGVCTWTPVADGLAPHQIPGDCKTLRCKEGSVVIVEDDNDVPSDGEDCTADECVKGNPVFAARPDESACTKESAPGTCRKGVCTVQCGPGKPACPNKNACTPAACDVGSGTCIFTPLNGVAVPGKPDKKGDCQKHYCIHGADLPINDDFDLPLTATPCDQEICNSGVPSNPPLVADTPCNQGMLAGYCDGKGACVECNSPTQCAGMDDECGARTCNAHVCGFDYQPNGTKLPPAFQTPDDCAAVVCDGMGKKKVILDPSDDDDGLECTVDSCAAGPMAVHTPKVVDTPCGLNLALKCDAAGKCVGCTMASQCPAGNDCKTAICDMSEQCGFTYAPAGTPLPPNKQVPGNCHTLECDGIGGTMDVVDDSDVTGMVCSGCNNGKVVITYDAPCVAGIMGYCSAGGACVQCNTANECPQPVNPLCATAACTGQNTCTITNAAMGTPLPPANQKTGDCTIQECDGMGNQVGVAQASDVHDDNNACTVDTCNGTQPLNTPAMLGMPPAGSMCPAGTPVCDGMGNCVQCNVNGECGNNVCYQHACCVKTTCALQNKTCSSISDNCGGMIPCGGVKDGTETDVDCGGNLSQCATRCALTQHCSAGSDCGSGACADTICCNIACSGCNACTATLKGGGADGACGPVAPNTDPHGFCGALYQCNGSGACFASCVADANCKSGKVCDMSTLAPHPCIAPKAAGQPCSRPAECASNICAAGTCM